MIEITPDEQDAYQWAVENAGTWSRVALLRDKLRDMTAEAMRLEFEREHQLDYRTGQGWCNVCHCNAPFGIPRSTLPIDPRHAYQWPDWQRAAHEALIGESK